MMLRKSVKILSPSLQRIFSGFPGLPKPDSGFSHIIPISSQTLYKSPQCISRSPQIILLSPLNIPDILFLGLPRSILQSTIQLLSSILLHINNFVHFPRIYLGLLSSPQVYLGSQDIPRLSPYITCLTLSPPKNTQTPQCLGGLDVIRGQHC